MHCSLVEQIYITWFRAYFFDVAAKTQRALAELCPWSTQYLPYQGCNLTSPVRKDFLRPIRGHVELTREERHKRFADVAGERKQNWTQDELAEVQDKRYDYHRRVANPVQRLKAKAKFRKWSKPDIDAPVRKF